jgi:hypothetical protein
MVVLAFWGISDLTMVESDEDYSPNSNENNVVDTVLKPLQKTNKTHLI